MLIKNKKEIIEIHRGKNVIIELYHGKTLIWQIARSCFGSGYWINERPWVNTDGWKN